MKIAKEVTTARRFARYLAMMGRNRRIVFGRLIGAAILLYALAYTTGIPEQKFYVGCEKAIKDRLPTAVDICGAGYLLTGDSSTGARYARALQRNGAALDVVERIANDIGDSAAGADAWLAVGLARDDANHPDAALAAYQRAINHRASSDVFGRMSDQVALLRHDRDQGNLLEAAEEAAVAYGLAQQVAPAERVGTLINIATVMLQLGNTDIAIEVLGEIKEMPPAYECYFLFARGLVELDRGNPKTSRQLLLAARTAAQRNEVRYLAWEAHYNLVEDALLDGAIDEAATLLDGMPLDANASPNDRGADAYYRARLALARKQFTAAAAIVEEALRVPSTWTPWLEATRGHALLEAGDLDRAEQVLTHAIAEVEHKRDTLKIDSLKSWVFAQLRAPYEDLVRLYVARGHADHQNYAAQAFAVVQQATARSTLDELMLARHSASSAAEGVLNVQQWASGMRKLTRSLRSSPSASPPAVQSILDRLHGNHVITYFRAGDQLWAIVVFADGSLTMRVLGDAAALAERAAAWRENPADTALADELGGTLLPDDLLPPTGTPIYIVADQPVADLSFAALRTHGEYVVTQHPVAYSPSASVLASGPHSAAPNDAIVLGDPTGDLADARKEAEDVASKLKVKPMIGAAATTDAVLSANDATLVHIAAHTVRTPTGIALQLSDGVLDAATIVDHRIHAGAFVLLTCSSGAPNGHEMETLASAFLAAGAHTVVASKWAILDEVGAQFASAFYHANGATDPVRAVAVAQRELLSRHVPVAQWSSFVVLGGIH